MNTKTIIGIIAIIIVAFGGYMVFNQSDQYTGDTYPEAQSDPWHNNSYSHRKMVNVTHVNATGSNLLNCTIFLNVTKEPEMQADFDDILFYEMDGTAMSFEYENHTASYGLFWVLVPTLTAASDTQFYVYYGNTTASSSSNPEATWNSGYVMVQHLQEAPSNGVAGHLDSTSNNNDGIPQGFDGTATSTTDGTGKIDGADVFDGSNDYVDCGNDSTLNITDAFTVEMWMKTPDMYNASGDNHQIFDKKIGSYQDIRPGYALWQKIASGYFMLYLGDGTNVEYKTWSYSTSMNAYDNQFFHFSITLANDGTVKFYFDGENKKTDTFTVVDLTNLDSTDKLYLGNGDFDHFNGTIDEIRISNVARSMDWTNQSYQMVANQSTYVTWSAAEDNTNWYLTGLDYNGTRTLAQINTSINSINLNQIVYTNKTGYSWTYTYGSATNGAIEVKQGQAFWVNVTGTIEKARVW